MAQVWADTLGGELAACCTGWVQQPFPGQYLPQVYKNTSLFQLRLPSFCFLGLNLTLPNKEVSSLALGESWQWQKWCLESQSLPLPTALPHCPVSASLAIG